MTHGTVMPVEGPAQLAWSEKARAEVAEALSRYPVKRSAVLPVLWIAQREWGWLPSAALRLVAESIGLPESEGFGIATFYTMFNMKPVGRHHLQVCMTLSCSLMGADRLFKHLENKLGVGHGETTADGRFRPLPAAPRRVPGRLRRRAVPAGGFRLPREPGRAEGRRAAGEAEMSTGPLL